MITNSEEYINGLYSEIERLKNRNKIHLYRPADELSPTVARRVVEEFGANYKSYILTMTKCVRCVNEWEIIIEIL